MEFKNILELKDGTFRIGFDITEEDYIERTIGLFGSRTYKALDIGDNIQTNISLLLHLKAIGLEDNTANILTVKHNGFSGYIYFSMQPRDEWVNNIKKKYNIN